MRFIGTSIQEAIDWAQDYLATTRPLAERTLFSLIADKKMRQTQHGYVLLEDDGEVELRHQKMKSNHGHHGGYRFHKMRRIAKNVKHKMNNRKRYAQKIKHVQEQLNVDADADAEVSED